MPALLLVDDDPRVREDGAVHARASPDFLLASACESAADAVAFARSGFPFDAALVPLYPAANATCELVAELVRLRPGVSVVVTGEPADAEVLRALVASGVRGFVPAGAGPKARLDAVRDVLAGGSPLPSRLARRLLDDIGAPPPALAHAGLTRREADVLDLLAQGVTYAEAARRLGICIGTVQTHVKSIYRKLDVGSKTEAAALVLTRLPKVA